MQGLKLTDISKFNLRRQDALNSGVIVKNRSHASADTGDMTIRD